MCFPPPFLAKALSFPALVPLAPYRVYWADTFSCFPRRRVHVWLFFFFTIGVPAFLAVGLWFVFQVVNGLGVLGGEEGSGVAYAAHIGGFIAGLILVKMFVRKQPVLVKERKSFW
jgi:membrane associated rhomboid family serine protease